MKFGISIPSTIEEARALDITNKNDFWEKALQKVLKNAIAAFQLLEHDEHIPV